MIKVKRKISKIYKTKLKKNYAMYFTYKNEEINNIS